MGMAPSPTTRPRTNRLLAVLLVAPFMAQADATIANVAAPSIHGDLRTSGAEIELVIGGYLIAFAVLLITGARLGQTHGYRRVFLLGVGVFTGASLLCGLAPGPIALIASRVIQGAGAALMFPQALTGIQLTYLSLLGRLGHPRLRDRHRGLRGHRRARRAAGPRRHAPPRAQLTSRSARRPRARRRRARVTRMPSRETARVIFDSPAMRSLKTKGTSSMRLPIR
jgi:MFS transporter